MNTYTVVDIVTGTSKVKKTEGRAMLTITLKNEITKKRHLTYVIDGHKNVRNWDDVYNAGIGARVTFNGLERISGNIIDADCVPHIVSNPTSTVDTSIFVETEIDPIEDQIKLLQDLILTMESYKANPNVLEQAYARLAELQA